MYISTVARQTCANLPSWDCRFNGKFSHCLDLDKQDEFLFEKRHSSIKISFESKSLTRSGFEKEHSGAHGTRNATKLYSKYVVSLWINGNNKKKTWLAVNNTHFGRICPTIN